MIFVIWIHLAILKIVYDIWNMDPFIHLKNSL
jgi:hypothetical protein